MEANKEAKRTRGSFPHHQELENLPRCDVSVWDAGTTVAKTVIEVHIGSIYQWVAVDRHAAPRHVADQLRWLAEKIDIAANR